MKKLLTLIMAIVCLASCTSNDNSGNDIELRFKNGKFKIAQFTDIHWDPSNAKSESVPDSLLAVLEKERPDLVIMTGDIVTGRPAEQGWKNIMAMMQKAGIPYAVTMGNHDPENMERDSIFNILATDPLFVGEKGPQELCGCGNYTLPILASDSDNVSALLYCLDSGDYSDVESVKGYAWIKPDQINWYRNTSKHYTAQNGGEPLPALAFFHIATPEYRDINENTNIYGCNKEGSGVGAPEVNSGFLLSCLEMGDVMGMFVGHDHNNDYIGQAHGIALAYGRVSGFNAYGDMPRGARIIELTEGKRTFDTWISTPAGVELTYYYPTGITLDDLNNSKYLPARDISASKQGVNYTYYEGVYKNMKDFPLAGKKVKEGTKTCFSLEGAAEDHFAYDFNALINIPEKDVYIFHLTCDDGAQLYIDGELVVDNGEAHSADKVASGKVALEKGLHDIRVVYYENYMGEVLNIEIESRNMARQSLADNMLFIAE
ncbi:MAG: metallophosphoesterase [Alistipes sp.]|nr:metallophosphoesterase [Alistipes sp.]